VHLVFSDDLDLKVI